MYQADIQKYRRKDKSRLLEKQDLWVAVAEKRHELVKVGKCNPQKHHLAIKQIYIKKNPKAYLLSHS